MTDRKTPRRVDEIEGLRAVCVLLVLFFHVEETWLPSGYLGVDAFFAISGYVITRMMVSGLQAERFSLRAFYLSRVARLMPALMTLVLLTLLAFIPLYGPSDYKALSESALASTLSVSNFYFYFGSGYFSDSSIYKPLLHTWSLGVEEQYYLVWPAFALLLWRVRLLRMSVVAVLFALCLAATLYWSTRDADMTFFLTPFRFYQFLIGALFALLALHQKSLMPRFVSLLAWPVTAVMVVLSFQEYNFGLPQTMAQAGISILVAFACWAFDRSARLPAAVSLLGNPVSVFIGARSYAIYLVHWPITLGVHAYTGSLHEQSLLTKLAVVAASLIAGFALSALVERPLRIHASEARKPMGFKMGLAFGLVIASVSASSLAVAGARFSQAPQLAGEVLPVVTDKDELWKQIRSAAQEQGCRWDLAYSSPDAGMVADCMSPDQPNVLVLGDSLNLATFVALANGYPGTKFTALGVSGCPPYFGDNPETIERMADRMAPCSTPDGEPRWAGIRELIPDGTTAIIVNGSWMGVEWTDQMMRESVEGLAGLDVPVGIITGYPMFSESVIRLTENGAIDPVAENDLTPYLLLERRNGSLEERNRVIFATAAQIENVTVLDISSTFCEDTCPAFEGSNLLFIDTIHPTMTGIRKLSGSPAFRDFLRENVR